ncbi:MAG: hypothetical protein ACN6P1_05580 [Pseudomonas sp.]|uniref:hypothetical protein n=1 Tax=Pseudomonas sp. TaxID=306 RepID=UPI003D109CED
MATLAQQRAAIAAGMRSSRQGTSEASRRATGEAMVSRRTGRDEVDDLNAVITQPRQRTTLRSVEPRGGVPAQVGRGNYTAPPAATGGGIASPLTEKTRTESGVVVPDRDYHPLTRFSTTDGLLMFAYTPTSVWRLKDADDNGAVINIARPKDALT